MMEETKEAIKALVLLLAATCGHAADWSLHVMIAGGSADIVSSIGHYEANPLARSANGRFSPAKAVPLKAGICAGLWLVRRKWPTAGKAAMYTASGIWAGVALRNRLAARSPYNPH